MNMLELIELIVLLWINIGTIVTLIGTVALDVMLYYERKNYIKYMVSSEERGNYKISYGERFMYNMYNGFMTVLESIVKWPKILKEYWEEIQLSWDMLKDYKEFGDYKKRHSEG